jgi:cardiolipin synthase C
MTRSWRVVAVTILAAGIGVACASHCSRLPVLGNRPASIATTNTAATTIGSAVAPLLAAHPDLSGIFPLRDARDAFAARYLLASRAERTLDVQY